jgi:hypothetical protein
MSAQCTAPASEEARPVPWFGASRLTPHFAIWIGGVAATLVLLGWVLVSFRGQPVDDPYITYRYAANIASGDGYVYNAGERVQSTTTPLFTLLLALGGVLGLDIPDLAYWLNALALLAFGVCCVGLVSSVRGLSPWLGLAAAAMTYVSPVTHFGLGSEMPILVALAWGSWWAAASGRWGLAAFLAGLASITRGDGVLVAVSLAIFFLATEARKHPWRRWPWHALLSFGAVVVPWYTFAWLYFGSPFPATLGTKIAQGSGTGATLFFEGLGYVWTRSFGCDPLRPLECNPLWWRGALALGILGFGMMLWRKPNLIPVVSWALLFTAGYSLLSVPRYLWYYSPLVPVAMLLVVLGGAALVWLVTRGIMQRRGPKTANAALLAGGLAAALLFGGYYLAADARATIPQQRPWLEIYAEAGRWLRANTPPDASVGASEVGIIGFHSDRRMIDFAGLIQPDVAEHAARLDNLWVLEQYRPDYIVEREKSAVYTNHPWVRERYDVIHIVELAWSDPVTILKRK